MSEPLKGNWLSGFVNFQHHTNPRVIWFDAAEWSFFAGQVQSTVHVIFSCRP